MNMWKKIIFLLFSILFISCSSRNVTKGLKEYLSIFEKDIDKFKIVCIIPVDGCKSCILPSLNYFVEEKDECLLVLASYYTKSLNQILEQRNLNISNILVDYKNISGSMKLVFDTAPSIYFLRNGNVIRKVDLSKISDQKFDFMEIDKHLKN